MFWLSSAHAGESRSKLLPEVQEQTEKAALQNRLAYELRPCFAAMRNGAYPSGYARIKVENGPRLEMDRSTFSEPITERCLLNFLQIHSSEFPNSGLWSYVHIVSQCRTIDKAIHKPNFECKIDVFLNNFSAAKDTDAIIEKHWKASGAHPVPLQMLINLINVIHTLSKP